MPGKMTKVSNKPKDAGVYYRLDQKGVKTFYINYRHYGKPRWEKIGKETDGFNAKVAMQTRIQRVQEVDLGTAPKLVKLTLDEAWKRYYKVITNDLHKSAANQLSIYNNHIKPRFGHMPLSKIRKADLKDYQADLTKKGLQPPTVYGVIAQIGRIFRKMDQLDLYRGPNPLTGLEFKNTQVQRQRFLTHKQGEQLLRDLRQIDLITYRQAAFALYAGMRVNEVLQLCKDRVNLDRREIRVKAKHSRKAFKERIIIIENPLVPIIEEILAEKEWEPTELWFPNPRLNYGKLYKATNRQGLNDGYTDKDRANWISFHSLRHTYGSLLADSGVPPKVIMEMMGHETLAATERYVHVRDDMMHEAAAKNSKHRAEKLAEARRSQMRVVK